jgi:hypothetical protein
MISKNKCKDMILLAIKKEEKNWQFNKISLFLLSDFTFFLFL